jgi:hypothetical protein
MGTSTCLSRKWVQVSQDFCHKVLSNDPYLFYNDYKNENRMFLTLKVFAWHMNLCLEFGTDKQEGKGMPSVSPILLSYANNINMFMLRTCPYLFNFVT